MKSSRKLKAGKASTKKLLAIRCPVTIVAAKGEGGGPATFSATAYSGGVLPGYTAKLEHDIAIDLSGLTATRNLVANLDHVSKQRVGHVTEFVNDQQTLELAGLLSAATPHRDEVVRSAADGFNWEVSIETELSKLVLIRAGKSTVVNGKTITGPVYVSRASVLTGVAFVTQGADEGNVVRIAAAKKDEFATWLEEKGWGADDEISDDQRETLRAAYDAERGVPAKPAREPTSLEAMAAAEKRESERVNAIRRQAHAAMKSHPDKIDQIQLLAQRAEEEVWDPDRFELAMLRAGGTQAGEFRGGHRRQPIDGRVIEAALCLATRLPNIEKHYDEATLAAVDKNHLGQISLQQLLVQAASANGYDARPGEHITKGNLRTVLEYAFPPAMMRRGLEAAFSTISLPGILGNVANKEITAGFEMEDVTWKEISAIKSVTNFHTVTSYRMTDSLEYIEVGPAGEIQHGTLGEESYTRQAKTYARMLGLTRQDIINDDLGALNDLRTRLGSGAARKFNNVFWTKFLDDDNFWTTARGNYIEGADTDLYAGTLDDENGLAEGVIAFRALRSSDGHRIAGRPEILLVPPEREMIARRYYTSTNVNTGGAATEAFAPNSNVFAGLYKPVVSDYLSDTAIAGSSATAWYLLRNPAVLAAMVVSFLSGMQTPTVESTDADFDTLGILFRGFHDFGCDPAEYLAGIKSKGAA